MRMRVEQNDQVRQERERLCRDVHSLWEVDELFRRPLVVLGITPDERRKLVRKETAAAGGHGVSQMLCARLLKASETINALSCRMSRLLRHKYEREAVAARQLGEDEFLARWREAMRTGRYGALLWAAATRPLSAEALLTLSRGIARLLSDVVSHEPPDCLFFHTERCRLRGEIEALYATASTLEAENEELRASLAVLNERGGSAQQGTLARQGDRQSEGRTVRPLLGACSGTCCDRDCNETCPSFDICRKRVLIVGGVERMEALYRQVIEGGGGELDYHSGSLQGGTRQLEKSLRRADIILCPINCNSHGACIKVKTLAKKHNKTCYMLPNGSMSTISRLLGKGGL